MRDFHGEVGSSIQTALVAMDRRLSELEPGEISGMVEARIKAGIDSMRSHLMPTWLRVLYFVMGYQHVFYNSQKQRFYPQIIAPDSRTTANYMRRSFLQIVGSEVDPEQTFEVTPRMVRHDARLRARIVQRILTALEEDAGMRSERVWLATQRAVFGGSFLKVFFDKAAGPRPYIMPEVRGPDGSPTEVVTAGGRSRREYLNPIGKVLSEVRSPFEVVVPAGSRSRMPCQQMAWIGERRVMSLDEIRKRWGVSPKADESAFDIVSILDLDLGRFFSTLETGDPYEPTRELALDSAFVYEMHCAPTLDDGFEEGRRFVVAAGELVENTIGEMPAGGTLPDGTKVAGGELPYSYFPLIPHPLRFHGNTTLEDQIDPQVYLNRGKGHIERGRRSMSMPWIFFEEGTIDPADLTSGGRVISTRPTIPGQAVVHIPRTQGLNQAAVTEIQSAKADIDGTAAQFAASRGEQLGASPMPVGTIEAYIEADQSELRPGRIVCAQAWSVVAYQMLCQAKHHYDVQRFFAAAGETEDPGAFSKDDIDLDVFVRVRSSPQANKNKAALRAQFVELAKTGMIAPLMQDPSMIDWLIDLFDMPSPDSFLSLTKLDRTKQEMELSHMLGGEPVEVDADDEDEIHIKVLTRLKKTWEWDAMNADAKQIVQQHIDAHRQAAARKAAEKQQIQMMMQQMAMGGGGPGMPGGGPGAMGGQGGPGIGG